MTTEILFAGFGGQGILSMGKILAYAAVLRGKEVTWLPSYGPEQRGGTSNVTVVVSDEKISSPIVGTFDILVALNQQSLSKFEQCVKPGGLLVYDTYGISESPRRRDIDIYSADAMRTAAENGLQKTFSTLVLGALMGVSGLMDTEAIIAGISKTLPERYKGLMPANEKAVRLGMGLGVCQWRGSSRAVGGGSLVA